MKLTPQTPIVITGAASGMGAACAQYFQDKAPLALLDLTGDGYQCDVTDAEQVAAVFAQIAKDLGPVAVCINCAGIAPAARIVGREGVHDFELFKKTIDINLNGTFNVMRFAAQQMQQREPNRDGERGVIINTASVSAFDGQIGQAAYSASKGGVVAMMLPAAREFAQFGIRVNTIAPGIINTPMLQAMPEKVQQSLADSVPFPHRLGYPEEFASLTAHIIDNAYINASTIRLDGALRMAAK